MSSKAPEATRARADRAQQARRQRVSTSVGSPAVFRELYVRPYDEDDYGPLPDVAFEILRFLISTRRGVLWTPPEFLKTTLASQLYPLWLTARYAVAGKLSILHGMLVSEEADLAERNLSVTSWHIEFNELIAHDFVDLDGNRLLEPDPGEDKWTDAAIVVRRSGVTKDPTWQAKSLRSQGVQGARINHMIADDIVTPLTAHSPAKQREAKHLWEVQFLRRVLEAGQAIVAGNYNSHKDLLSTLAARADWKVMRRPSLHIPGDPETAPEDPRDPEAVETLPQRWPRRRLLTELSSSPSTFAPVHLLRSSSEGGDELQVAWVQLITMADVPRKRRILIGLDPAPGAEVDPDPSYFSLTLAALSAKHLDVLKSVAVRCETTEQVDLLARYVTARGPISGIAVAKIALDRYFEGAVLVGHPELRPYMHPVSIHDAAAKPGRPKSRLAALGAYAKSGWLRVVETAWNEQTSGHEDRDQEETLGEQWASYPQQNHDDRLDSLDVLVRDALELAGIERREFAAPTEATGQDVARAREGTELAPGEVRRRVW